MRRFPEWILMVAAFAAPAIAAAADERAGGTTPLRVVVMDPLSKQLACDCVGGYAQRDYGALAAFLQAKLDRGVELIHAEALSSPQVGDADRVDLIVGKYSLVVSDARRAGVAARPVAMLSGQGGKFTQTGLFVVRHDDTARSIEDLADYRFLLGPADSDEKHSAALAALEAFGVPAPAAVASKDSCSTAALAVAERDADVAVISSYAMPLLEGCGTVEEGELRVVGVTDAVPFIGVFATDRVTAEDERLVGRAMHEVRRDRELLAALESRDGFLRLPSLASTASNPSRTWNDWRGPGRSATSPDVPDRLPDVPRLLWSRTMTGPGMAGLAVADGCVVVADKDLDGVRDIFRCLDADTGRERWKIAYPAAGAMDFTNSPRANPVIHDGLVYLLGAFGHLHCIELTTGLTVWKKHLPSDFGAGQPMWGYCSAPLLAGDRLIVNPGAPDAALVALDRRTGKELWRTSGRAPGYATFILAELGGRLQAVGYDVLTLGGWDPQTGRRLWELTPELPGDFNVPTPVAVAGRLLVSTENNGTRLYGFDNQGRIQPDPLAVSEDLSPDTSTPVLADGMLLGNFGGLVCLDLDDGLRTLWETQDDDFCDYCSFIAGNGHVLVTTQSGRLHLLKSDKQRCRRVATLELFEDVPAADREVWSHPALVGNRFYVRNLLAAYCFVLE